MKSIAIVAALLTVAKGEPGCQHEDEESLLQVQTHSVGAKKRTASTELLQTAHAITQKVNSGQDPNGCAEASGAAREAVEAALAAIPEQYQHLVNQIHIAEQAVEVCASREVDGLAMVTQQGTTLVTRRAAHATCRENEENLEGGLVACEQFAALRNSLGNEQCFPLPLGEDEGDAWVSALETAVNTLQGHLNTGRPLRDSCNEAREALAGQQAECTTAQSRFEEDFCAHRASCADLQICRASAEENYVAVEAEVQASLESLHSEYLVMKHVECLLGMSDDALAQNTILSDEVIGSCSEPASLDHLMIDYPTFDSLTTCDTTILTRAPCNAGFFAAEYQDFAKSEEIQEACTECSALPLAGAPLSWLRQIGVVDLDNLQPREGSPAGCTCTLVELQGEYSAGPVVRCDNCIDTFRSTEANSCPNGFKLYSPRSQQDWETLFASVNMNEFRSPHHIVDITRPENGCGGCRDHPMNSDSPGQSSWVTSDGSPWFFRSSTYGEPNGDYTANCYMFMIDMHQGEVRFNDGSCSYHSNKYLCQMDQNAWTIDTPEPVALAVDEYIRGANCCGWNYPPSRIAYDQPGLVGHNWNGLEVTFEFTGTPIVHGVRVDGFTANSYDCYTSMDQQTWNHELQSVEGEHNFASPRRAKYGRLVWNRSGPGQGRNGIHAEFMGVPGNAD